MAQGVFDEQDEIRQENAEHQGEILMRQRSNALWIGNGFWLMGCALIIAGFPQWAWVPIGCGGFALGYRCALGKIISP